MIVKREGEVITITLDNPATAEELQRTLDYARVLELSGNMKKLSQSEVDLLANEVKSNWWSENKSRFTK